MNSTATVNYFSTSSGREKLTIRYIKEIKAIVVKGRSSGLEVFPAYTQLLDDIDNHFQHSHTLNCYLQYTAINASTTKLLFKLFKKLVDAQKQGNRPIVYWVVEEGDNELMDIGLDLKNLYNLDFIISFK